MSALLSTGKHGLADPGSLCLQHLHCSNWLVVRNFKSCLSKVKRRCIVWFWTAMYTDIWSKIRFPCDGSKSSFLVDKTSGFLAAFTWIVWVTFGMGLILEAHYSCNLLLLLLSTGAGILERAVAGRPESTCWQGRMPPISVMNDEN